MAYCSNGSLTFVPKLEGCDCSIFMWLATFWPYLASTWQGLECHNAGKSGSDHRHLASDFPRIARISTGIASQPYQAVAFHLSAECFGPSTSPVSGADLVFFFWIWNQRFFLEFWEGCLVCSKTLQDVAGFREVWEGARTFREILACFFETSRI